MQQNSNAEKKAMESIHNQSKKSRTLRIPAQFSMLINLENNTICAEYLERILFNSMLTPVEDTV